MQNATEIISLLGACLMMLVPISLAWVIFRTGRRIDTDLSKQLGSTKEKRATIAEALRVNKEKLRALDAEAKRIVRESHESTAKALAEIYD